MSSRPWNVATAKAELSRVLRRAQREPQVIESRGEPVAVVLGIAEYRRIAERERSAARWKAFLDQSASLRADGGVDLDIPPRDPRPSPFKRSRR